MLEELGRGAMGVVYKARQVGLNRLVAVKMILAGEQAGPERLARFQSEAEAIARLQHPNIVQIYEIGTHQGLPYFSLEFVDGGTLAGKTRHTPQPAHPAAQLLEVLARAAHAAHRRGIVHRDLKPANILLAASSDYGVPATDYGVPKISDFGLVKLVARSEGQAGEPGHTASGMILGTPSYMAPEQAQGNIGAIGPATDVYALGAILYQLLTGQPPFVGSTSMDVMAQVLSQPVPPPSQLQPAVPAELEAICLKCLNKEPADRYASAEALADELDRFLEGLPLETPPVSVLKPTGRLWSRRLVLGAGVAAGLAGLVPLGWWLLGREAGDKPPDPNLSAGPLSGELTVRVWTEDGTTKPGLRLDDPGALPVREDEMISVQAELNQAAYVYLLWLDGKGAVTALYPWHARDLELKQDLHVPPPALGPVRKVYSPYKADKGWIADEARGLETILLLARRTPWPAERSLARFLGNTVPAGPLNGDPKEWAVLVFDRGKKQGITELHSFRGPKKQAGAIDSPMLKFMARLEEEFELIRAVRFAHVGK
jgi:hypothetical protein